MRKLFILFALVFALVTTATATVVTTAVTSDAAMALASAKLFQRRWHQGRFDCDRGTAHRSFHEH